MADPRREEAPFLPREPAGSAAELDAQDLMKRIRASIHGGHGGAVDFGGDAVQLQAGADISLPRAAAARTAIPIQKEYRLEHLLAYNDADFVRNAHRAMLGRDPDAGGLETRLRLLNDGSLSKIDILGQLRNSPEGRRANVRVPLLGLAVKLQSWRRIPVIGRLLGIVQYVVQLPVLVNSIERQQVVMFRADRETRAAIDALAESTEALTRRLSVRSTRMGTALDARLAAALDDMARLSRSIERLDAVKTDAAAVAAQLSGLITKSRLEAILADVDPDHGLEHLYAAFEERFRGSREEIKSRVSVYLPFVREAGAGTSQAPVLDLGCGRGEWLEVLRDSGLVARGLDHNHAMAQQCRELGLDAVEADVLEYLRAQAPGSLGAVTGIHIIEHLPFASLVALFDEALRALRPGGVAIFETPNPENLLVGACNFWYDPTHRHPLPPLATQFVAQARGYGRVDIVPLHPYPAESRLHGAPEDMQDRLNQLLFGPQDYAVVAFKT